MSAQPNPEKNTGRRPGGQILSPEQRRKKNKLERGAMIVVALALILLSLIQREVIDLGPGFSESQGLVALVSINVSVLLMTVLLVLVLRYLYRIFFERQGYGSLQTKMVVAFIFLSLVPTLLIFYYSYRQLVRGHDLWFSPQIESALKDSIELTEVALEIDQRLMSTFGQDIVRSYLALPEPLNPEALQAFLDDKTQGFHLSSVELYSPEGLPLARSGQGTLPLIYPDWFERQWGSPTPWANTVEIGSGDLTRLVWPIYAQEDQAEPESYLVISRLALFPVRSQLEDVRHALVGYQDALKVQRPFRVTQLTALTAMTMLAVFLAVWIGSHLAGSLARPVTELVDGTRRVAEGDWDFALSLPAKSGEFAELVDSFNRMTGNLKEMYSELDSRRRLVETVLRSVSTGVVILDIDGRPININPAGRQILAGEKPSAEELKSAQDEPEDLVLPAALTALVKQAHDSGGPHRRLLDRHIHFSLGDSFLSLTASVSPLYNEDGLPLGYLLSFDDLTELERAQRLAAWREVARRIAHEVKNPLTPIQLSAQRLRRRFLERLAEEKDVAIFQECTEVIIRQVDEMKKLVDEFSRFARLPEIKPRPGDFEDFLGQSLALFRQAHPSVSFELAVRRSIPIFSFDPEQMRRVLTNILDNAVAAMEEKGQVELVLDLDEEISTVILTVSDSGPGLDPQIQDQLFEPHISTKEGGQGLGLAIVRTIVSDHGGFIKAKNRPGGGAVFTVELPLRK